MNIEEIKLFLKEMEAVKKMQHYLPIDILNDHIADISNEVYSARKLFTDDLEALSLIERLEICKNSFEKEIHNR